MALGYENTGIAPGLISKAGSAMAESIRQTGEKIRGDIIQHNTDRQVVGLLTNAAQVSVSSPTFQQDLLGVLGKYPMALGDPRAQIGLSLLGQGWKQQKQEQDALTSFNRQKELYGMRYPGGRNGLAADLPPLNVGDMPEMPQSDAGTGAMSFGAGNQGGVMGRFGAGVGQGMQFGAGMRDQGGEGFGTPERELPNDLPPIPEPGAAQGNPLFDTDRVLRGIPGLDRATYAKTMARTAEKVAAKDIAGGKPMFRSGTSDIVMVKPDGSSEVVYKADPKAKAIFVTQEGDPVQQLTDGKWKWPDGSIHEEAPEVGIKRVPGFTEERRAEQSERKTEVAESSADKKSRVDALKQKFNIARDAYNKKLGAIERLRGQGRSVPQEDLDALAVQNAKLEEIFAERAALEGEDNVTPKTRIIERGGRKFEVDDATKKVLREIK